MTSLYEQHRPTTLDQIIGQPKAITVIKRILNKSGAGGQSFWISGASGTGKTTLAKIIANSIADQLYQQEFDSADMLTVAALDKIEQDMSYFAFGRGGWAFIVNEAHGLRQQSIRRLLGLLERIPGHVCFIFTTTKIGQEKLFEDNIDSGALLSRCIKIELTNQGLSRIFAEKCRQVAIAEGLDGKPLQSYIQLAAKNHNNLRAMYQAVEAGCML